MCCETTTRAEIASSSVEKEEGKLFCETARRQRSQGFRSFAERIEGEVKPLATEHRKKGFARRVEIIKGFLNLKLAVAKPRGRL